MKQGEEYKDNGSYKAALGSSSLKREKKLEQIILGISGKRFLRIGSSKISNIC
jgi:hypothetical protein